MLRSLQIRNLALISSLNMEFSDGLNVLSGETGAGKSIIVDSLVLLLGGRYDKTILRYGQTSGFVEGVFDSAPISAEMEDMGIDEDETVVINRKFNADGRNEIRINGRVVTLSMLRNIAPRLFDICGQNEHQSLGNVANHIKVLDYYVRHKTDKIKANLTDLCTKLRELNATIDSVGNEEERLKNIDYLSYCIEEITNAAVKEGEEQELIELRKKMYGSETVKEGLSVVCSSVSDGEESAIALIGEAQRSLSKIEKYGDGFTSLLERLNAVAIELDDISAMAKDELDGLDFTDEDLDEVEKRLDTVRTITRKYGAGDTLKSTLDNMKAKVYELENADELYSKAIKEKAKILEQMYDNAQKLSQIRKEGATLIEKSVESQLETLGMKSVFKVVFSQFPTLGEVEKHCTANGMDEVEFFLSPNVGQPLKPLVKIISGGELSRLMLALKVVSSASNETPTMIFDEIDTGISGKIGLEVGKKLAMLSTEHQLLCVTHLPQICAMADKNFYISKHAKDDTTFTEVQELSGEEVFGEISRLTGAQDISSQSISAAKDMKEWSDNFKRTL